MITDDYRKENAGMIYVLIDNHSQDIILQGTVTEISQKIGCHVSGIARAADSKRLIKKRYRIKSFKKNKPENIDIEGVTKYTDLKNEIYSILNIDNIYVSKSCGIVEVFMSKNNGRHNYIIKPNGIDSNSNDDELNQLVIKHYNLLIDLAEYRISDDVVAKLLRQGVDRLYISRHYNCDSSIITRVIKKMVKGEL